MPKPPGARPEDSEESHNLDVANEPAPVAKVAPKPAPKRLFKVRATRAGFIHNERKVEGDVFEVKAGLLGSWFEYEDPIEQKKHLKGLADKKKSANLRGIQDQENELADE